MSFAIMCSRCEMAAATRIILTATVCEDCFDLLLYDYMQAQRKHCGRKAGMSFAPIVKIVEILGASTQGVFIDECERINEVAWDQLCPGFVEYKMLEIENASEDFRIESHKKDYQTPCWQKVGRRGRR